MKTHFIVTALAVLTVFAACERMDTDSRVSGSEIAIRAMGEATTRSAINGTAFPQTYDMKVSAYRNLGEHNVGDTPGDYFENIHFAYDGGVAAWKAATPKYWPLDGTLDLLAVASAGYHNTNNGVAPSLVWGESSNVSKKVILTVPDNSEKFDDILYGASNAQRAMASGATITFNHAQTAVVFTAHTNVPYDADANVGITINRITVDGAKYSGTLTVSNPSAGGGSGELAAIWTDLGSVKANVEARVWASANTGSSISESSLSGLNLTNSSKSLNSYPFGEAYVILPPQDAVPFTIHYTIHNGFKADGITPNDNTGTYQHTPDGTWDMGKKNVYDLNVSLTEILVKPSIVDWAKGTVSVPVPEPVYSFAGFKLSKGPLYYNGTSYVISDDWTLNSYNSVYGKEEGSTYFSFYEMGEFFEKSGFSSGDGEIDNLLDPLQGWRLPTQAEWYAIVGNTGSRSGSTVNGAAGKRYARIQLTGVTYATVANPRGLIIFPDGETLTGKAFQYTDNYNTNTSFTLDDLNNYLDQGCVFLPSFGSFYSGTWRNTSGEYGSYWSSSEYSSSAGRGMDTRSYDPFSGPPKETYFRVNLIKAL